MDMIYRYNFGGHAYIITNIYVVYCHKNKAVASEFYFLICFMHIFAGYGEII
jgi:hypothetical protein